MYYCDNETVDGVEFPAMPQRLQGNDCVVADMSSNFLSRPLNVNRYAVIFVSPDIPLFRDNNVLTVLGWCPKE